MRFLLDTCIVSELFKPIPERKVTRWAAAQIDDRLFLSVLTLGELARGAARLPEGKKREKLETWIQQDLKPQFEGRWLPVTEEIAERWGILSADAARRGLTRPVIDGLLAATALAHGMTFVTRNEADAKLLGVEILNPWKLRDP